jgi:hypothetical protein
MRYTLVILFLAAAVIPSVPQRTNQIPINRVSMDLGSVTVWLGMSKAELTSTAKASGYNVGDRPGLDNEMMMWRENNGQITQMYLLAFTKTGLLKYASRTWPDDNVNPYEAVLGALETIDGQTAISNMIR